MIALFPPEGHALEWAAINLMGWLTVMIVLLWLRTGIAMISAQRSGKAYRDHSDIVVAALPSIGPAALLVALPSVPAELLTSWLAAAMIYFMALMIAVLGWLHAEADSH